MKITSFVLKNYRRLADVTLILDDKTTVLVGANNNDFVTQSIQSAIDQNGLLKLEHTHHHKITLADSQASATVVAGMEQPLARETIYAIN